MKATRLDIFDVMHRQGGVISYGCPIELHHLLRRLARDGTLASVLPGVFAARERLAEPLIRMHAARLRDPDVVFTGLTAAHVLWGFSHAGPVTATGRSWSHRPGFRFSETLIDPAWVVETQNFRCTAAALTAVDLIPSHGSRFVDHLLRVSLGRGSLTLQSMWDALAVHPHRPGNPARRRILHESRDYPCSEAERRVHAQLRAAGIKGWRANYGVETSSGRVYFLDIAFPDHMLAIEVDGYETHSGRVAFEQDRHRQNDLVADGWNIIRVTWEMMCEGRWVAWVLRAFSTCSAGNSPAH